MPDSNGLVPSSGEPKSSTCADLAQNKSSMTTETQFKGEKIPTPEPSGDSEPDGNDEYQGNDPDDEYLS